MYFCQAGVFFSIENANFLLILAFLLQFYAIFGVLLQCGGVPKLTNIEFSQDDIDY